MTELELPDIDPEVVAWANALAERLAREDGFEQIGTWALKLPGRSSEQLTQYWVHGKGALKVRWGTDGSMKRCIRHLRKHVIEPGGLCAKYHKLATGEWPTTHGKLGIPS